MKIIGFMAVTMTAVFARAQEVLPPADMDLITFIVQAVQHIGTLQGLSGQALVLAAAAVGIRILISTLKVSMLRQLLWDKLPMVAKMLAAPVLGVLLAIATLPELTVQVLVAGLVSGALGIAVHHLLKVIEGLPGISATVQAVVQLMSRLLGGARK
ncbi:MAG: hypothetical protein IPN68_09810 [Bacteroidetes bacterium]|nr:hypothetical protein [Bacteroidota bacterium]